MNEAKIIFDEELVNNKKTTKKKEFGFFRILRGLFIDGQDLANEVNAAVESAYAEN